MKGFKHVAAGLTVALSLMAGGPPAASASELTIARSISTTGMDPGFLREAATLVDNIFDTLILRDEDMQLVPGLATEWTAVDDTTWEFTLREGVTFHNGEPFNAEAVKYTLDRVLDPDANAPTISYIRTIAGVEVVDDMTVRITTTAPDPLLPTRMSRYPAYIVPPGYVEEVGQEEFARNPVGTGPYRMTEFLPDEHVVMEANADYWRGAPSIDTVTWRVIPEDTARIAALISGEVDLVEGVPAELVELIDGQDGVELVQVKNGGLTIYLGLKMNESPLDDVRVRQALSLAIDRAAITETLLRGFATPKGTQVGPFDFGYLDIAPPAQDLDRARELLAEAGYPDGFDIRMQGTRTYLNGAEVSQAIVQQFGEIGVTVELEVPEWSVYIQQVPAGEQAPIYMLGWGSTQTLDADAAIYAIFKSGEPYSTVSIPEMDELLDQSRQVIDPAAREEILHRIQELAAEQVPVITLYQQDSLYARRSTVDFDGRPDARIPVYDIAVQ